MRLIAALVMAFAAVTASAAVPPQQRDALIAIYNATGGPSWTNRTGWLGAAGSECNWYGVQCNDATTSIVELRLEQNELTGAIPPAFGSLPDLRVLLLHENKLTGTIPSEIGSLAALVSLRLGNNQLAGTIPQSFAGLKNLEELDFYASGLTGTIPPFLAQLTKLKDRDLTKNQFEGTIPAEVLRMTSLEELYLGENRLTGTIPTAISGLVNLQRISLYGNRFSGTIPLELTTLTKLITLELQQNALEGTIPPQLAQLTQLESFDFAQNKLTGTLPAVLGTLTRLRYFSVYENQIEGPIPPEYGSLAELDTLYLTSNRLTGTIPDSLRNLKKLTAFFLGGNQLEGTIPDWIGDLPLLNTIYFPENRLTGTIPSSIGRLQNLTSLYLGRNLLTGTIPREIGNLRLLGYLSLEENPIGGPIPAEFWTLDQLVEVRLNNMALTGTLPPVVATLKKSDVFLLGGNELEGAIPPQIGDMDSLLYLGLGQNRFTGTLPPELGKLKKLLGIDVSSNALRGPVSPAITGMTALEDKQSSFSNNLLFANDAATRDFLIRKENWEFEERQTVTPTNLRVASVTDRSATLEWSPILYQDDPGGYQVIATPVGASAGRVVATTLSKRESSLILRGLEPSTSYTFTVATVTHPHDLQKNLNVSDASAPVSGSTSARVLAPADVVLTDPTQGLVQIDGVAANEDSFTLTNFGDVATSVTFNIEPSFFSLSPSTFTLEAGASQTVAVRATSQPLGTYYGAAEAAGPGTTQDEIALTLLSIGKPPGTVRAEPLATRIEVVGAPGSDSVGSARFRNAGTARLSGIVVSDQPWVVPSSEPVTIEPGEIGLANFRVVRSKRPEGLEGALTANLSLVYVDGSSGLLRYGTLDTTPSSGVSVSLVTVVDTSRPVVGPGSAPGLASGEVAFFATGVGNLTRGAQRIVSDVSVLNAASARSIGDLRLFFTTLGGSQTSVANVASLSAVQSVTLANVVGSVYAAESAVGNLQFRTTAWQNLTAQARLVNSGAAGTFTGDIPIFRSDRSAASGQQISLAGIQKSSSAHTDLYLQETGGGATSARVQFLNASGAAAGAARTVDLSAFGMAELLDAAPANATSVIVTNQAAGRLNAYARVTDDVTGDTWSVVDWSRVNRFPATEAMRVVFLDGAASPSAGSGRRRRAVRRNAIESDAGRPTTDLILFNPTTSLVDARVQVIDAGGRSSNRDVRLTSLQTLVLTDAGSSSSTPTAQAIVTATRGEVVVSARSNAAAGGRGTAVPVVSATAGLRLGQSQRFSGLDDSTADAVAAGRAGTFRTALGLVESSGSPVTVRARLYIDDGRSLVRAIVYRDFTLSSGQQLVSDNLVRTIIGASRDSLGELHNLQLQIEVVEGGGSVIPFLIITDNGTGDTHLRMD